MNKLAFVAAVFCAAAAVAAPDTKMIVKNGDSIAFLGDSITEFGNGPSGYVNLVMKGLEVLGVKGAVKIPAGIGGHKSNNMLERVDRDCLSKQPRFMTVSCGVNDVWHGKNGVPLDQYQKNMSAIFDKAAASNVTVIVLTPTLIGEDIEGGANKTLLEYVNWLKAEAKRRKLRVADLNAEMRETLKALRAEAEAGHKTLGDKLLTKDGVHMAFDGDCMMAWGVLKAFGAGDKDKDRVFTAFRRFPNVRRVEMWLSDEEYDDLVAAAADKPMSEYLHDKLFVAGKPIDPPVCDNEIIESIVADMLPVPGCHFLAGRTEVTEKQWDAVCKGLTQFVYKGDNLPANNVSWNDCREFIFILNQQEAVKKAGLHFRLPTEWEWEYAAMAGGKGTYAKTETADEGDLNDLGWWGNNSGKTVHPVAEKTPNAWGFYDMHGNVWEWTSTSFDAGCLFILKGGSFQGGMGTCGRKFRMQYHPPYRGQSLGLRLFADKYEE